jgi:uncharacterized protein
MAKLGRVIIEALVHHYGRDEVLRRLSHPFWFQSFGAVMGMDWHSSGITTSVLGALKRGLAPIQQELGLYVCGGRGRHSRETPMELARIGERTGLDGDALAKSSRLVAKVDSAAVQDGYDLYLHGFIVSAEGRWCVVQQGMNETRREARRYHWLSENLTSFLDAPHAAIEGQSHGSILNLADTRAAASRSASLDLLAQGPDHVIRVLKRYRDPRHHVPDLFSDPAEASFTNVALSDAPHLRMPNHHDVRASDVQLRRLHGTLAAAAARAPIDFTDLLLTPGVGGRTVASLAFVAEVIHGTASRFSDPARFSLAHGGKDGHPFPVPLKVYDETLRVLKSAVAQAKLGNDETLAALQRLDLESQTLERVAAGPGYERLIEAELARSSEWGGRAV